jgi:hypothetical protein
MLMQGDNPASFNYPQDIVILLKINEEGELEGNFEEIKELASAYDRGWKTEETEKAKIIELLWKEGWKEAMDFMTITSQRTALLMGEVAGNA